VSEHLNVDAKGKGKAFPLQAWIGPWGFQEVEAPRISRQSAHGGGKVVSPTHRPSLPPGINVDVLVQIYPKVHNHS
jgi:hypothetical protein